MQKENNAEPQYFKSFQELMKKDMYKNMPSYEKQSSLYIPKNIDFTQEPMFLGKGKNTQRFDDMKYSFFDEKNMKMQGFDWAIDEAKLKTDYVDFNTKMQFHEKFMYTKVLQKLIFLDSLQGRGILLTLGHIVSLPELENAMLTWEYFEGAKHSKTYTENLRGVYDNPSAIFDESFEIPELMLLAKSISNPYNEAYELIIEMQYNIIKNKVLTPEFMKSLKKAIIKLIVVINILEGIRFYSGFACIWALNKGQGYVEGTSKNLKFICRDENQHLALTQKILQNFRKNKSEGFQEIYQEMRAEIVQMYKDCFDEEVAWIYFLFQHGSIIGLNAEISIDYLKYVINRRLKAIGESIMFSGYSSNPIPWIEPYINMDKNEILPQEGEVLNYVTGGVNNDEDLDETEFSDLIRG